jgi:lipopolysaccharide export system permease protein
MIIKTYNKFIIKNYFNLIIKTTLVFASLSLILNLFEEINYYNNIENSTFHPVVLTLLNLPSIIYDIFPFIFLISIQFFFLRYIQNNELNILKQYGIKNSQILKTLILVSLVLGFLIVTIFYNISAKFKNIYIDLKNTSANDNKYLAVITENGLWIKDEIGNSISLINADRIEGGKLVNVTIFEFDTNHILKRSINSESVDIQKKEWIIYNPEITENNIADDSLETVLFNSNFDYEKINQLYSNLSSLTFLGLRQLQKDYDSIGYSSSEIKMHLQKMYAYPFILMIISLFSGILMFNIKNNKNYFINIIIGIILSVLIYYINYISYALGNNDKIPIILSIWLPSIILLIFSFIGLVRINEK